MSGGGPSSVLGPLARQGRPVHALLASDLCFHLGFYMLLPFLGSHLERLGHDAASIGFVLGLRALGQHGLSLVGGYASDRFGPRVVIVAGCWLRAASFVTLGFVRELGAVVLAVLATGAASALFRPALSAMIAAAAQHERPRIFAASTLLNEAGALLGPLLGVLILRRGFGSVCLVSGALFFAAGGALAVLLPPAAGSRGGTGPEPTLGPALRNRRLWAFALATSAYFVLFDQMYLSIPLELSRVTGGDTWTGVLFAGASALVVLGQLPTTRLCQARLSHGSAVALGLALMATAFVMPLGAHDRALPWRLGVCVAWLTLGTMVAFPFVRELIPRIARERALGAHHGLFFSVAGVAATFGNTLVGKLRESTTDPGSCSPWLLLVALGLSGAVAVYVLERRGALAGAPELAPQSDGAARARGAKKAQ